MTREDIEKQILEISEQLKGPRLSNIERLLLHADRKDLRSILAEAKQ